MDKKYGNIEADTEDKEFTDYVRDVALLSSRYVFIDKHGKGCCTHCKEEYKVYGVKHNEWIQCPKCGSWCKAKLLRYKRKYLKDSSIAVYFKKEVIESEEVVTAKAYLVTRDYSYDYEEWYKDINTKYQVIAKYIFNYKNNNSTMLYKRYWYNCGLYERNSIFDVNIESLKNVPYFICYASYVKAIQGTRLRYMDYTKLFSYKGETPTQNKYYYGDYTAPSLLRFIDTVNRYPIMEQLWKAGFANLVIRKVHNYSFERQVNFKAKDIFSFLKLNKGEVKELKKSGAEIRPQLLKAYRESKKKKWGLSWEEADEYIHTFIGYGWRNNEMLKYIKVKKALKYVKNQYKKYEENYYSLNDVVATWNDYVKDLNKLEIQLNEKNLMPKDLLQQHQNFLTQIKHNEDEKVNAGIMERVKKNQKFHFEYNGLLIRPAMSSKELIEEGDKQSICIGGYGNKYSKGECDLFFIRKLEEPNEPYYAVEIIEDEVRQVRGKCNCKANEEVEEFMKVFKEEKLNKKNKKAKKVA